MNNPKLLIKLSHCVKLIAFLIVLLNTVVQAMSMHDSAIFDRSLILFKVTYTIAALILVFDFLISNHFKKKWPDLKEEWKEQYSKYTVPSILTIAFVCILYQIMIYLFIK